MKNILFRTGGGQIFKNIQSADSQIQSGSFVDKPQLLTKNFSDRIFEWLDGRFWMTTWLRFVRRDFLIENDIKFQPIIQEDNDWSFRLLCLAENFLRVPNQCYIYRQRENSITAPNKTLKDYTRKWMEKTVSGLKIIDNFMNELEFFQQNPAVRYAVIDSWVTRDLNVVLQVYQNFPLHNVYEILKEEFKVELGVNDTLTAYLISKNLLLMKNFYTASKSDNLTQA